MRCRAKGENRMLGEEGQDPEGDPGSKTCLQKRGLEWVCTLRTSQGFRSSHLHMCLSPLQSWRPRLSSARGQRRKACRRKSLRNTGCTQAEPSQMKEGGSSRSQWAKWAPNSPWTQGLSQRMGSCFCLSQHRGAGPGQGKTAPSGNSTRWWAQQGQGQDGTGQAGKQAKNLTTRKSGTKAPCEHCGELWPGQEDSSRPPRPMGRKGRLWAQSGSCTWTHVPSPPADLLGHAWTCPSVLGSISKLVKKTGKIKGLGGADGMIQQGTGGCQGGYRQNCQALGGSVWTHRCAWLNTESRPGCQHWFLFCFNISLHNKLPRK